MTRLAGKIALITGAARGIGLAFAKAYVAEGARVVIGDIDIARAQVVAEEIGTSARAVHMDVTNQSSIDAALDAAIQAFGQVDILINNAGASMGLIRENHLDELVSIDELLPETWDHFINTNLSGAWYLTRAVIPRMKKKQWGRIINVTTSFFTMLRPMFHPYGPAKAALEAMSAGHAGEFARHGITVNVVVPGGPCDTPMVPAVTNIKRELLIPPRAKAKRILRML